MQKQPSKNERHRAAPHRPGWWNFPRSVFSSRTSWSARPRFQKFPTFSAKAGRETFSSFLWTDMLKLNIPSLWVSVSCYGLVKLKANPTWSGIGKQSCFGLKNPVSPPWKQLEMSWHLIKNSLFSCPNMLGKNPTSPKHIWFCHHNHSWKCPNILLKISNQRPLTCQPSRLAVKSPMSPPALSIKKYPLIRYESDEGSGRTWLLHNFTKLPYLFWLFLL